MGIKTSQGVKKEQGLITVVSDFFDAAQTVECGQTFRFYLKNGEYTVFSGDKRCSIATVDGVTKIHTDSPDYFYSYFDLSRDYGKVISGLSRIDPALTREHMGIHILRQQLLETIICFIISANNNIPRIKGIIERLCALCGDHHDDYYAFPTLNQLTRLKKSDLEEIGCGYRSGYLVLSAQKIADESLLDILPNLNYNESIKTLTSLAGVGRKVADCIALFALGHLNAYPVDTWIIKANGGSKGDGDKIRQECNKKYGDLAGFVQQYQYYNSRIKK